MARYGGHRMREDLRLRICSGSERSSVQFARLIFEVMGIPADRVVVVAHEPPEACDVTFEAIRAWGWSNCVARLRRLSASGIRAVLLADSFLDWPTPDGETIEEWLAAFERAQRDLGLCLVVLETYDGDAGAALIECFGRQAHWPRVGLQEVVSEMCRSYRPESIVLPYGMLPCFFLEPERRRGDAGAAGSVKALVGFQPWSSTWVLRRFPHAEPPIRFWLPVSAQRQSSCPGPVPCLLELASASPERGLGEGRIGSQVDPRSRKW